MIRNKKIFFLFNLLFFIILPLYPQIYTIPASGDTSYTLCSGILYDHNGMENYGNNCDGYAILYPSTPGHFIRLSGQSSGERCCDYLYIYDGAGTNGPMIWYGVADAGTIPMIPSTTGPLTVRFTSDGSGVGQGFALNISCCNHCSCDITDFNLQVINSGTDFITIQWNGSNSVPNYIIEYGPSGFTPGTGLQYSTTNTTYTINRLREGQNYDIYIYFDCDNDNSIDGETYEMMTYSHTNCIDFSNLNDPIVVCTYGTFSNPFTHIGVVNGRHTIMNGGADPYSYGQLFCVPPGAVNSVRLGNSSVGAEAESITYTFLVDTNINDFLILRYAAVLQNPPHSYSDQPRFVFKILNAAGLEIDPQCCSADFVSGNSTQGWNNGIENTLWNDWTYVGVDVSPYHGQNIKIQLITYDCSPAAHFGYTYFTLECGGKKKLNIESCGNAPEITYSAPRGFHYRWYLSTNPNQTISTNQSVSVSTYSNDTLYCDVSFIENASCNFVLSTAITPLYPLADFTFDRVDCEYTYSFTNNSTISNDSMILIGNGRPCDTYYWDFGNGETSRDENPTTIYSEPGNYVVRLIAGIINDACQDTIEKTLTILPFEPHIIGDTICCEDDYKTLTVINGVNFLWNTGETTNSIIVNPSTTTTYSTVVTHIDGCTTTLEHTIKVYPIYTSSYSASICEGDSYTEHGFNLLNVQNIGLNDYTMFYTTKIGCDSIITLNLEVKPLPIVNLGKDIIVCFNEHGSFYLDAGKEFDTYLWNNGLTSRTIQVNDTGLYSVSVSLRGCEATDSIKVINICPLRIYLPNTITPHLSDGINDYFYLLNSDEIKELDISIYNRWGQVVFNSKDVNFKWDGKVNGKIFHNQIYSYYLFVIRKDEQEYIFKGTITVL